MLNNLEQHFLFNNILCCINFIYTISLFIIIVFSLQVHFLIYDICTNILYVLCTSISIYAS